MIDRELLEIMACPVCKAGLRLEDNEIVCIKCFRRYPIRNGIPVMLIEESRLPDRDKNGR